jgi:hypothetical protein
MFLQIILTFYQIMHQFQLFALNFKMVYNQGSLGHLFKLSNYKQHFLILISILAKTNAFSFNL